MLFLSHIIASPLLSSGGGDAVSLLAEARDRCLQRGKGNSVIGRRLQSQRYFRAKFNQRQGIVQDVLGFAVYL